MSSSIPPGAPSWRAFAGAISGPALWALNTQLAQILPYLDCATRHHTLAIAAWTSACLALLAGWASWLSARTLSSGDEAPRRFVGQLSTLMGVVFAMALGLQGLAALIVNPCER